MLLTPSSNGTLKKRKEEKKKFFIHSSIQTDSYEKKKKKVGVGIQLNKELIFFVKRNKKIDLSIDRFLFSFLSSFFYFTLLFVHDIFILVY